MSPANSFFLFLESLIGSKTFFCSLGHGENTAEKNIFFLRHCNALLSRRPLATGAESSPILMFLNPYSPTFFLGLLRTFWVLIMYVVNGLGCNVLCSRRPIESLGLRNTSDPTPRIFCMPLL